MNNKFSQSVNEEKNIIVLKKLKFLVEVLLIAGVRKAYVPLIFRAVQSFDARKGKNSHKTYGYIRFTESLKPTETYYSQENDMQ